MVVNRKKTTYYMNLEYIDNIDNIVMACVFEGVPSRNRQASTS